MKVVILWLINEKGEVLMARRAAHMSTDAGVWGPSVSGKVDDGESFEEAALREAQEELGLEPAELAPLFLHKEKYGDHSDGRAREFGIYHVNVKSDIILQLQLEPDEVSEVKWFTVDELKQLVDQKSETIIISSATDLWRSIFTNLESVTVYIVNISQNGTP